jgi:Na+(H+)/acetate symporter ActP
VSVRKATHGYIAEGSDNFVFVASFLLAIVTAIYISRYGLYPKTGFIVTAACVTCVLLADDLRNLGRLPVKRNRLGELACFIEWMIDGLRPA